MNIPKKFHHLHLFILLIEEILCCCEGDNGDVDEFAIDDDVLNGATMYEAVPDFLNIDGQ